jgi:hypothetical protein
MFRDICSYCFLMFLFVVHPLVLQLLLMPRQIVAVRVMKLFPALLVVE